MVHFLLFCLCFLINPYSPINKMSFPYLPIVNFGREELVTCPFNSHHKMCESSLQRHIIRCRKNYPTYVSCPYNAMHFFRTNEILEKHLPNCPCKPDFPEEKVKESEQLMHEANLQNVRYWNLEYENWDNEYTS